MEIKSKTVLVTGAASGLGAATARHLSGLGAQVILCDIADAVFDLAVKINGVGYQCDIHDEQSLADVLASIGSLHIAVNCAGIVDAKRLVGRSGAMPLADFKKVIDVNVIGTFNVMRLCAEKMSQQPSVDDEQEQGVIINTASIAAFEGQVGQVAYAASKGAVASMTLPAARELARFGVRVMTIAPGVMKTPMVAGFSEEVQTALCADVPFPNALGDPDDFAKMVAHIIENTYLNGSTIRLDGALRLK